MVFLKTKHSAEKLSKHLENIGFAAASIHGNKSQSQRERALKAFKDGEMRVLVATDVAARGIDIPGVTHVYNYDLPTVAEAYVHRIGRTARAGKEGIAIAFCAPDEIKMLRDIEKLTKVPLTVASGEPPADTRGAGNQPSRGAARPARKPHRKGQGRPQGGEGAEARDQQGRPARRPQADAAAGGERKQGNNGHHQAGRPNGDRNRSDRPGGQKRGNRGGKPGGYTRAAQG
jgi:ATP-dependent RNA helicase RhlE